MHGRICTAILCLFPMLGCTEAPQSLPATAPTAPSNPAFDAGETGTIAGRVEWQGDVPTPELMTVKAIAFDPLLYTNPVECTLPHYPRVQNGGVGRAVVFLRGIDPARARPWDHPKARVEFRDRQLRIEQGNRSSLVGFVRLGDDIAMVNRDTDFHLVRARGAAFFAAPLKIPDETSRRRLDHPGIVELTDGAGYLWLHAHLFVAEHPYYALTDGEGRFTLLQVPAGTYELVCWMPSWRIERRERDPETGIMARTVWRAPKEKTQTVEVRAGRSNELTFDWARTDFE